MIKAFKAGALYFAIVFAAGFILGAARVGWLAPAVGEIRATLVELPVILGASWIACRTVIRRMKIEARTTTRLTMGAVAFGLLIAAEIALGLALMSRTLAEQIGSMSTPPALMGLAGQVLFAFFPLAALLARR